MSTAKRTVWLSGRFMAEKRAHVPATSLAVMLGIGLYETLRLVQGHAPLLELHLARLHGACRTLGLRTRSRDWPGILGTLASRNRIRNGQARITIGDGFELATCARLPRELGREREQGISLVSASHPRAAPELKGTSRLPLWLAERSANGEALLVSEPGQQLLETTRANLFVVTAHGLETAPTGQVLPGIARGIVLELAAEMGVPVQTRAPDARERTRWREVFVTNALRGLRPVCQIDAHELPLPGPGTVTRRLQEALDERMGLR